MALLAFLVTLQLCAAATATRVEHDREYCSVEGSCQSVLPGKGCKSCTSVLNIAFGISNPCNKYMLKRCNESIHIGLYLRNKADF